MNSEPKLQAVQTKKKKEKESFTSSLFEYLELFAWSIFAVMMLFTFALRLCRVDGISMENTLYDRENLLLYSIGYTPKQDDLVVFHLPEKEGQTTLVKRVIATGGQEVVINFSTKEIRVDGELYEDSHAVLKTAEDMIVNRYTLYAEHHYDPDTKTFSATVPEGYVFLMGDNRNNSKDSRNSEIGFVDERCILGKAFVRVFPFTIFP